MRAPEEPSRSRARAITSRTFATVAETLKPAVVNVFTEQKAGEPPHPTTGGPFDDFFERFFGPQREQRRRSLGSGVIIDPRGYVVTNNHVVENADEIEVQFSDERRFKAEVVGTDPPTDLAVLRIKTDGNETFHHVDFGRLRFTQTITTVSHWMKHEMWGWGADPQVIPNGIPARWLEPSSEVADLARDARQIFADRAWLVKVARWDPDKSWLQTVEIVARLRELGRRPLLIARGGREPYGADVLSEMRSAGLRIVETPGAYVRRDDKTSTLKGLQASLQYFVRLLRFRAELHGSAR